MQTVNWVLNTIGTRNIKKDNFRFIRLVWIRKRLRCSPFSRPFEWCRMVQRWMWQPRPAKTGKENENEREANFVVEIADKAFFSVWLLFFDVFWLIFFYSYSLFFVRLISNMCNIYKRFKNRFRLLFQRIHQNSKKVKKMNFFPSYNLHTTKFIVLFRLWRSFVTFT